MKLWEYVWFQDFIWWCRKWEWFDYYIYGMSFDLEDFVRNPAEVLRDHYFPFIVRNINAYSVINVRCGYLPYSGNNSFGNSWSVPMGDRKWVWQIGRWRVIDLRLFNPWYTKFCNAIFFFQFAVSLWHYIPIPYVSLCIKIAPWYFQFGLGWGAEVNGTAVLCAKFRFVNEATSDEAKLNPSDVLGYYEGTI